MTDDPPRWPPWFGFVALLVTFGVAQIATIVIIVAAGAQGDDELPAAVTLAAALVQEIAFLAVALFFAARVRRPRLADFGLRPTSIRRALAWMAAGMACFYLLAAIYVQLVGDPEQSTAQDVGADESQLALLAAGVLFICLAPIGEEFFFRGFFYGSLRTSVGPLPAALIGGTVFGVIHAPTGLSAVPPLVVLGIVLCVVRERTGSLYPCIAIHAINNTIAYAAITDADPGVAAALGVAMLVACVAAPRIWRSDQAVGA